jgi:hypothetical protein
MIDKFYAQHLTTDQVRRQLHAFIPKESLWLAREATRTSLKSLLNPFRKSKSTRLSTGLRPLTALSLRWWGCENL